MKLLFENWRKFIEEDAATRKAFADEVAQVSGWEETEPSISRGDKEAYKKAMTSGRVLKKLFHKYADQSFLNSLVLIHWGSYSDIREIVKFGKTDKTERDELSVNAFLPGEAELTRGFGIVVKGRVTLLANDMDELYSGFGREYRKADPQRAKMSGANKGVGRTLRAKEYEEKVFVFDKEDWAPRSSGMNEALVDNWKITHIITDEQHWSVFTKFVEKLGLDAAVILRYQVSKL